jgi:chromosomal replication initiation ATPase DnaA
MSNNKLELVEIPEEIDEKTKIIKLKASTEFIQDWISRNYAQVLESCLGKYQALSK